MRGGKEGNLSGEEELDDVQHDDGLCVEGLCGLRAARGGGVRSERAVFPSLASRRWSGRVAGLRDRERGCGVVWEWCGVVSYYIGMVSYYIGMVS